MSSKIWENCKDIENGIKGNVYTDPDEFIRYFESFPSNYLEIENGWSYRGHAFSDWKLLPQCFRSEGKFCYKGSKWPFPKSDPLDQLNLEADIIIDFAKLCDHVGIQVPMPESFYYTMTRWGNEIKIRFNNSHKDEDERYFWDSKYHESLAYAQHYGIPTRLLDLTNNPLYAAFFAIYERFKIGINKSNYNICVWCINLAKLKDNKFFNYERKNRTTYNGNPWHRFKTIHMPWSRNQFMKQQEGLFIIDRGMEYKRILEKVDYQPIEDIVKNHTIIFDEPILLKIELKSNHDILKNAMKLLKDKKITDIKLMPSLQNIAKSIDFYSQLDMDIFN